MGTQDFPGRCEKTKATIQGSPEIPLSDQQLDSERKTLQSYREKISDPSEWSQSYPWECSCASKFAELSISAEDEYLQTISSLKRMHMENMDPEDRSVFVEMDMSLRLATVANKQCLLAMDGPSLA
ncbi:hypothetical protein V6N11_044261 [Hibiscus sabdariffa]|uniref:Uncharacterized protein n=1 Tax=Hibiscus sabdariffa TaxID=183260 RepID=A0ABR2REP0_9ROSI